MAQEAIRLPAADFLTKPLEPNELIAAIELTIEKQRPDKSSTQRGDEFTGTDMERTKLKI